MKTEAILFFRRKKIVNVKPKQKLKAKEYLHGQSIAAEICNFGEVDRCMIKKETNNIIFKYQIKK